MSITELCGHVLVVEDNQINQHVVVGLLEEYGLEVTVANHGQEALDILMANEPDTFALVLMDLQMPVLDGIEATRRLREEQRFQTLPVIALTADAQTSTAQEGFAVGLNDFVLKPIEPSSLFDCLLRWLTPSATSSHKLPALPSLDAGHLPVIPDVDLAGALARVGGSHEKYISLLAMFQQSFAGFAEEIEEAWPLDPAKCKFLSHKLAGAAGNLGAFTLCEDAQVFEMSIGFAGDAEISKPLLRQLLASLGQWMDVIVQLRAQLGSAPLDEVVKDEDEIAMPVKALLEALVILRDMAEDADTSVIPLFENYRSGMQTRIDALQLNALGSALQRFDFEPAVALLDSLVATWKELQG